MVRSWTSQEYSQKIKNALLCVKSWLNIESYMKILQ